MYKGNTSSKGSKPQAPPLRSEDEKGGGIKGIWALTQEYCYCGLYDFISRGSDMELSVLTWGYE